MTSPKIELVLFDFGGVFTQSPFTAVDNMAREYGIETAVFSELMFGVYHLDTQHPWHQLERGEIGFDAAREGIMALGKAAGIVVDPLDLLMRMAGDKLMHDDMVQCLQDIKAAGYATAIITNNVREFSDTWRKLMPVDALIDRVFDSSALGMRKPDPAIYRYALQEMGNIEPKHAVFLDDVEQNICSAATLGIHGIHVQENPITAILQLKQLLGLV